MSKLDFQLSCGGKTFLLGEYYITQHGRALIANTEPRFFLKVTPKSLSPSSIQDKQNTSGKSPAMRFITDNSATFENYELTFKDPYQGLGGLGASTAEFLLSYHAYLKLNKQTLDKNKLLETYLHYAWNGVGTAPSAADLFAQSCGNLTYVNRDNLDITPYEWPFADLAFHLIHTHNKLATHEHLTKVSKIETAIFSKIVDSAMSALHSKCSTSFCEAINNYQTELKTQGLSSQHSQTLIKKFQAESQVLAAKGCGAMGSDIILLLTAPEKMKKIKQLCHKLNLTYIASKQNLTDGIHLEETVVS